eukprot:Phypoly_transcript_04540.p1 GENE.Phypoly_transcript_04540~~Phypoly_transcript_04540.p1  ORF type:complete len:716 (+),score=89.46 Phypoly_transcript_04540:233-2149(+)
MESGLNFADLLAKHVGERNGQTEQNCDAEPAQKLKEEGESSLKKLAGSGKLTGAEEIKTGSVAWAVYKRYIWASGTSLFVIILLLLVFESAVKIATDMWLSFWTNGKQNQEGPIFLAIYISIGAVSAAVILIRSLITVQASMKASHMVHKEMLKSILHSPLSFFDTTPVGRILNRFTKDLQNIDGVLPNSLVSGLPSCFNFLSVVVVICSVTPLFLVPALPLSYFFFSAQVNFLLSSRQVQRLEMSAKSPIYAFFSETLHGISTIRPFGVLQNFIAQSDLKINCYSRAAFSFICLERWVFMRIEFLSTLVITCAALLCIMQKQNIDPGLAGLSIYYALQMSTFIGFVLQYASGFLTSSVSVERALEYADLPQEPPHYLPERLPPGWPHLGEIDFDDLKFRYRPGLDLVLRGISVNIRPREKIGIVGRTGAGKSSVFLALLRTADPAAGTIRIDNIDITKIGLSTLRSSLSIIPQDPTLFAGTIKTNLDPSNVFNDKDIWTALDSVHMKNVIEKLSGGIYCKVDEKGDNFSVGERQLLCLGRALLRNTKILLMDEATASVDMDTDILIQQTIRDKFKSCTVLTIAHRINTILDYDRVMVMEAGNLVEYDSPTKLAGDPTSLFFALLQESQSPRKANSTG